MRQPFSVRRLRAAVALTLVALVGGLAFAPSASASTGPAAHPKLATVSTPAGPSGSHVTPDNAADCTLQLELWGQYVDGKRRGICFTAQGAAHVIGPDKAAAACVGAMVLTGVPAWPAATYACGAAVA